LKPVASWSAKTFQSSPTWFTYTELLALSRGRNALVLVVPADGDALPTPKKAPEAALLIAAGG
jgi:hypothetical protein